MVDKTTSVHVNDHPQTPDAGLNILQTADIAKQETPIDTGPVTQRPETAPLRKPLFRS